MTRATIHTEIESEEKKTYTDTKLQTKLC